MKAAVKKLIKSSLKKVGADLRRFDPSAGPATPEECREAIMRYHNVSFVIDVGANTGQYALNLRKNGYKGKISSYEPLSEAFRILKNNAANDTQWETTNVALGERTGFCEINISKNSMSSSMLPMLETVIESAPEAIYLGKETVRVETLDSLIGARKEGVTLLKLDTQGFERQVLEGGEKTLREVSLIECELSLEKLYAGQDLIVPMLLLFGEKGFRPISFHRGFSNPYTGHALQVDGFFCRS